MVPQSDGIVFKVDKVWPIEDAAQVIELDFALSSLRNDVCSNGHTTTQIVGSHTLTSVAISCDNVGVPISDQRSVLQRAITGLIYGQTLYGHAALAGSATCCNGEKNYGYMASYVAEPPPEASKPWPSPVPDVPIYMHRGPLLRVEPKGPLLDNWDMQWFMKLCTQGIEKLKQEGSLQRPLPSFQQTLSRQKIEFSFGSSTVASESPTRSIMIQALQAMRVYVFETYGARDLEFKLFDENGALLGVGYFKKTNAINYQTGPFLWDGSNTTHLVKSGELDPMQGYNSTTLENLLIGELGSNKS